MDQIITALRAIAEPTRLRLVALGAEGEWCVTDLVEILGQSQPRLSRHLRLLAEAGVFERAREGPNVFFRLADTGPGAALARAALARVPEDDPLLAADRHRARGDAQRDRIGEQVVAHRRVRGLVLEAAHRQQDGR
ncbi:winged helix-turn-helix transcriptional regulator, partial [Elioraea sp. Yellowstone]|uniref:ArsR/SmtB family transcription factor n=1 Tax=Elioraea sp. Yellowstone TaxID=2592070 RepID=UPI0011548DEF